MFAVPVQQVDHGEADHSAEEAVHRVQHGVPAGDLCVEAVHLPEDLRREDKEIDDAFEQGRDLDLQLILEKCRQQEKNQREEAEGCILILTLDDAQDH